MLFLPTKIWFAPLRRGINKYHFNRLEKMPDPCTHPNVALKEDPIHNFESLWHTFNEQYGYFKTRNIDWNASKEKYQSRINSKTTDLELFLLLEEMLEELNDGHVGIALPAKLQKAYSKHKEEVLKERLKNTEKKGKRQSVNMDKVLKGLLKYYVDKPKKYNRGLVQWGMINDEVALLQINGMTGMANYNLSSIRREGKFEKAYNKAAEKSKNYAKDEVDGARYIMEKVLADIASTKACIIDLRFNGGGLDEVALELLSHFTKNETAVFSKKAYRSSGFTEPNLVSIKPADQVYQGELFILTSHFTASAAEIFMMSSLRAVPDAVRIGSNTTGIFSDILEKELPNGWQYGLSNEIYLDMDQVNYEGEGISPHHDMAYKKSKFYFFYQLKTELSGGDEAVNKVLGLLRE